MKRYKKILILITPLIILLNACVQDQSHEWCEKQGAKTLRNRNFSATRFRTVDEMIRGVTQGQVALFAHRGGFHCEELDNAPENSLSNVKKAVRMGFDGYETDLWRTSDGEFVIHHDGTLDRTTTGSGRVSEHSLAQIRRLKLKYRSGKVSEEKVPTLQEFLSACRGKIFPLIEPKGRAHEHFADILQVVKEAGLADQVLIWVTGSEEYVELYERHLKSGLEEVRTYVVWRVDSLNKFEDIVTRFNPLLVDLSPSMKRMKLEKLLHLQPKKHMSLVESVVPGSTAIMVSRIITNSYLDTMYDRGVRLFMSRNPEPQLLHLIEKGSHP